MKNIPIPSKNAYLKNMIFKLEGFIKRIRQKAQLLEKPNGIDGARTVNDSGFESVPTPPKNEHLNAFEDDLYDLVRNVEFKRANMVFQNQFNKDINMIDKNPLLFILADKFNNRYKVSKDTYCKLLQDNITKLYKKSNVILFNDINKEPKTFAAEFKLDDRIEQSTPTKLFPLLKIMK